MNLEQLFFKLRDLYQNTVDEIPVNVCLLNEDGSATNFSIAELYTFFVPSTGTAHIVVKPGP